MKILHRLRELKNGSEVLRNKPPLNQDDVLIELNAEICGMETVTKQDDVRLELSGLYKLKQK